MADQKFKSKVRLQGGAAIPSETASRALALDSSGNVVSSTTTDAELAFLSGVTSSVQDQITDAQTDATQALADAAAAQADIDNHIADTTDAHDASAISVVDSGGNFTATDVEGALAEAMDAAQAAQADATQALADAAAAQADVDDLVTLSGVAANSTDLGTFTGSIIPDNSDVKEALQALESEIEAIPSPFYYAGTWAASTNTPTLDDTDTGVQGAVYYVTDSGSVDFGSGAISFAAGDKVANNGTTWDKWDMTDQVASVNGETGAVVLDSDDISEGSTNLYFTDERAQDAVGTILVDTASVDLAYNDGTPSITATVLPAGVDHDQLMNFVANEHVDHSTVSIATAANTSGLTGGGDITATRNLSVDINGTTLETSADDADKVLIWDDSASALKSMSRANFLGGSIPQDTDDLPEGSTNLYFTNERVDDRVAALLVEGAGIDLTYNDGANTLTIASTITQYTDEMAQDAVGSILVDSASIDFTYDDGTPSVTAVVLPAGVDHDALANFVANEHVDHSTVDIATAADSGLTGGGDITATRNLSVDITGTTALAASPDVADEFLVWDDSASALKKVTYAEITAGFSTGSAGDIAETSFSIANNQGSAANVTGFAFASGTVRSFEALVSVEIDATLDLFEQFTLTGINKAGSFEMAQSAVGDESGIVFSITSGGQIQYTSANYAGFVSGDIKFRAITTTV